MSNLKSRLISDEALHGCWLNLGSNIASEIVAQAGFDWVLIDLEHGAGSESTLLPQLQGIAQSAATPIVRVESFEAARVKRVLDMGASGVMFPLIRNLEDAKSAIAGMHYPPDGIRGVAKMVRATQFGENFESYFESAKENLLGIIQIETRESLKCLDQIAAIKGVDVLFLGPADLSMALGVFGQWDHPDFVNAVKAIGAAARNAGKAAGVLFFDLDQYDFYYQHGFRFLASCADMNFVRSGAHQMVKNLNQQRSTYL
jgi:4-hydroxy-2-oxoheptanedioate aldolase